MRVAVTRRRRSPGAVLGQLLIHVPLLIVSFACLAPILIVLAASLSSEKALARQGYGFIPRELTAFAYRYIFLDPSQIGGAYLVTVLVTLVGSASSLLVMALLAYALSRRRFRFRKPLSFFVFFTMLFNGGLVPSYILITQYLHLKNSLLVLILPHLVVPWYVLLLRTYFVALPEELLDSARMDGASEWRIFFQIVVPLSTPALATVGLFCMLLFWNDWFLALLYIDRASLVPLQLLLYNLLKNVEFLAASPQTTGIAVPAQTVRMAMAILAMGPITIAFLFLQRFFIRGITLGGLKDG